jgi:hypothetical protein
MFQGCNGGAKSALGSFRFQIQKLKIKVNDQCFKRPAHNCLSAYLVLEGLEQEEWDNWMPHEPDVAPAADQPNEPQQELMPDLNMVPFFELQELLDGIDQIA